MKPVWGLTGGIGSGKTTVLSFFQKKNDVLCINTDRLAKEIMSQDDVVVKIGEAFGIEVIHDGWQNGGLAINYPALAEVVFSDEIKRRKLESIVHPLVWEEIDRIRKEAGPKTSFVLVESAIVFETNSQDRFDGIICAFCGDKRLQIERVVRRGTPYAEALLRADAQIDPKIVSEKSDYVIYTDRYLACVKMQVEAVYRRIKEASNG